MPASPQVAEPSRTKPFLTVYDMPILSRNLRLLDAEAEGAELAGGGCDCPRAGRGKGSKAGQAVKWASHSRAGKWMTRAAIAISCEAGRD